MTQLYKLFLFVCLLISSTITAQNKYMFSTGVSIPDNISNKYLRPGIFLGYAIDFKIYKNLFVNTGLSLSFNNKNKSYTFGFDDEPRLKDIPYIREGVLMDIEDTRLYLFNTTIELAFKYRFLDEKKFSPYLLVGFNGNYSIYENPLFDFDIDENNEYWGYNFGGPIIQQFNIGYSTAIGVNYKAVFLELNYRLLPNIKFGTFEDPTDFFILKVGVELPFNNK